MLDAARLGVVRMDLEAVLAVPGEIRRAARLRADVVLREDAARGQQQRILRGGALVVGT
jgi:hypothetical protein